MKAVLVLSIGIAIGLAIPRSTLAQDVGGVLVKKSGESARLFFSRSPREIAVKLENRGDQCRAEVTGLRGGSPLGGATVGLFDSFVMDVGEIDRVEVEFKESTVDGLNKTNCRLRYAIAFL